MSESYESEKGFIRHFPELREIRASEPQELMLGILDLNRRFDHGADVVTDEQRTFLTAPRMIDAIINVDRTAPKLTQTMTLNYAQVVSNRYNTGLLLHREADGTIYSRHSAHHQTAYTVDSPGHALASLEGTLEAFYEEFHYLSEDTDKGKDRRRFKQWLGVCLGAEAQLAIDRKKGRR